MQNGEYTNRRMLRDLWRYIGPYKVRFVVGSCIRASSDVAKLLIPLMIAEIINLLSSVAPGQSRGTIFILLLLITLANLYQFIVRNVGKSLIYQIAANINFEAQLKALRHLFLLDWQWHESENSGSKLKKVDRGGANLETIIRMYVDLLIDSVISTIFVMIVLFSFSWQLGAMLFFFFTTFYVLSLYLTRRVGTLTRIMNEQEESFQGMMFEMFNTMFTLKTMRLLEHMLHFFRYTVDSLLVAIKKRIVFGRARDTILAVYKTLFLTAVLLFTVWQVWGGYFEVGVLALVLFYFNKVEESAFEFSTIYNDFYISKLAVERLQEIFDEQPNLEGSGSLSFPQAWKTIDLRSLSFSYGTKPVLNDISFRIHRGEKIGIVGMSGAGKSTLFKLLLKLYGDYQGEILFDELSLKDIKRSSYVEHIAYVPQEIELFNMSLKTNIALSLDPDREQDERIQSAARIAYVSEFAQKLNNGLDTLVGEKGVKLSGGERQRVGIARAIYRNPDILFMDEATSHLDSVSERKIQSALHDVFKNTTAIVIAHRLSTLQQMDRIILIRQGRIVEQGTFDELLHKQGDFYEMWKAQRF